MYIARYIGNFNVYFHDIVQILGVRFTLSTALTEQQQDNWIRTSFKSVTIVLG